MVDSPLVNDKWGSALAGAFCFTLMQASSDSCGENQGRERRICAFLSLILAQPCCGRQNHTDRWKFLKLDIDGFSASDLDKGDHGVSVYCFQNPLT